ncbi:hypothetical protein Hanom_Chr05g00474711 [Helianthus anomalus]
MWQNQEQNKISREQKQRLRQPQQQIHQQQPCSSYRSLVNRQENRSEWRRSTAAMQSETTEQQR